MTQKWSKNFPVFTALSFAAALYTWAELSNLWATVERGGAISRNYLINSVISRELRLIWPRYDNLTF